MEWVEPEEKTRTLPPHMVVEVLRDAAAMPDSAPDASLRLAEALRDTGDSPGAVEILTRLTDVQGGNSAAWAMLARIHLEREEYSEALRAAERAGPRSAHERARALLKLNRDDEAEHQLRALLAQDVNETAFDTLSRLLALRGDGPALLELCDARGGLPGCAMLGLAFRALGLSLVGRDEEALLIVDPERHVKQVAFDPPAALGPVDRFNAELAAQILRHEGRTVRAGLGITYEPDRKLYPHLDPLHAFIRRELDQYIEELPQRGLDRVMPPPPLRARLGNGNTVLRLGGHHGDHLHPLGYVSSVYHVAVPDEITNGDGLHGHLVIGAFALIAPLLPSWPVRYIRPKPGMLTIFPSYFFHNVVPTQTSTPRISVAADMEPILQAGAMR